MFDIKKYFLLASCKNFYLKIFTENFVVKIFIVFVLKIFIRSLLIKFFVTPKKIYYNFMLFYLLRQHKITAVWLLIKTRNKFLFLLLLSNGYVNIN